MTSNKHARLRRNGALFSAAVLLCAVIVSCGGGGGSGSNNSNTTGSTIAQQIAACEAALPQTQLTVPTAGNSVPVMMDAGPCAYGLPYGTTTGTSSVFILGSANVPYVSVKVCVPGTSTCQVIDHIMVDTGSSGLRIMSSVLDSAIALPAIKVGSAPLIECVQFADGYSWGAMHTADVRIAGEVASGIPVQVIGDASSYSPPGTCSNPQNSATVLTPLNDVISFGANGVLGVGLFAQDCGSGCVGNANNFYYACPTTSSCAESGAALNQQATNPVYAFAGDNNGVLLQFPAVTPASGALNTQGSLIFGINTATNNQAQLNNSLNVYQADSTGDFFSSITSLSTNTYTYTSTPYGNSFIDSGSNGIYVPGTTIATETYGWFAPVVAASGSLATNVISLGATQQGSTGGGYVNGTQTSTPTGYTNVLSFDIANADTVLFPSGGGTDTVFNGLGAPSSGSATSTGGIDWGLPFFLGKSVYIGLEAKQITVGTATPTGPFWAY